MSSIQTPPLLRVRCGAQCGALTSGGHLIIEPGAARFEFNRLHGVLGTPQVIHAEPPLVWKRARLLPPGLNSGLIMRGEEGTVTVFTWWGVRRRAQRALQEAGLAVREEPTWLSVGRGESR